MPTYLFGTEIAPRSKVGTWQLAADRPFALPPSFLPGAMLRTRCTRRALNRTALSRLIMIFPLLLRRRRRSMFLPSFLPSTALFFLPATPPLDRRRLVRFADPNCDDAKMTPGFRVGGAGIDGRGGSSRPLAAFKALPRNCDAAATAAAVKSPPAPASWLACLVSPQPPLPSKDSNCFLPRILPSLPLHLGKGERASEDGHVCAYVGTSGGKCLWKRLEKKRRHSTIGLSLPLSRQREVQATELCRTSDVSTVKLRFSC